MPPVSQCVKYHWLILLLISSSILIQTNIAKKQPTRTTIKFVMVVERFLQLLDMPLLFKVMRSSNFKNWWIEMILANHCQEWAYKLVYQIPVPLYFISFKSNSVNCSRLLLKGFIFSWWSVSVLGLSQFLFSVLLAQLRKMKEQTPESSSYPSNFVQVGIGVMKH